MCPPFQFAAACPVSRVHSIFEAHEHQTEIGKMSATAALVSLLHSSFMNHESIKGFYPPVGLPLRLVLQPAEHLSAGKLQYSWEIPLVSNTTWQHSRTAALDSAVHSHPNPAFQQS